jgi:hypothetical protein
MILKPIIIQDIAAVGRNTIDIAARVKPMEHDKQLPFK